MSNTITTAFVRQYNANVTFLYQQRGSKLRGKMREKPISARYDFFDRIAPTTAVKKVVRHGNTPLVNSQHSRRRVETVDYEWADLVDKQDEVRLLINPQSTYAVNAALAMGRAFDDEAILAFEADAREGEDGSTTTTWASFTSSNADHDIAHGSAGLTVAKLQSAKVALDNQDVEEEGRQIVMSPEGIIDLLTDSQVTSADFNTVRALVSGQIGGPYMGLMFTTSTRLPITGNIRTGYAWHMASMGMAIGMDFVTRIDERSDKSYAVQVYVAGTFGGVRILDEGLVEINIDESA